MFKSAVSTVSDEAVLIRPKLLRPSSQLAVTSHKTCRKHNISITMLIGDYTSELNAFAFVCARQTLTICSMTFGVVLPVSTNWEDDGEQLVSDIDASSRGISRER